MEARYRTGGVMEMQPRVLTSETEDPFQRAVELKEAQARLEAKNAQVMAQHEAKNEEVMARDKKAAMSTLKAPCEPVSALSEMERGSPMLMKITWRTDYEVKEYTRDGLVMRHSGRLYLFVCYHETCQHWYHMKELETSHGHSNPGIYRWDDAMSWNYVLKAVPIEDSHFSTSYHIPYKFRQGRA